MENASAAENAEMTHWVSAIVAEKLARMPGKAGTKICMARGLKA